MLPISWLLLEAETLTDFLPTVRESVVQSGVDLQSCSLVLRIHCLQRHEHPGQSPGAVSPSTAYQGMGSLSN